MTPKNTLPSSATAPGIAVVDALHKHNLLDGKHANYMEEYMKAYLDINSGIVRSYSIKDHELAKKMSPEALDFVRKELNVRKNKKLKTSDYALFAGGASLALTTSAVLGAAWAPLAIPSFAIGAGALGALFLVKNGSKKSSHTELFSKYHDIKENYQTAVLGIEYSSLASGASSTMTKDELENLHNDVSNLSLPQLHSIVHRKAKK